MCRTLIQGKIISPKITSARLCVCVCVCVCVCMTEREIALTFKLKDSSFFLFTITFTALCVHQGRNLLLAWLTQPSGIPGWVEVHWSLSSSNMESDLEERIKE